MERGFFDSRPNRLALLAFVALYVVAALTVTSLVGWGTTLGFNIFMTFLMTGLLGPFVGVGLAAFLHGCYNWGVHNEFTSFLDPDYERKRGLW